METDEITKMAAFSPVWAPVFTLLSLLAIAVVAISGEVRAIVLPAIVVPMALIASLQVVALRPLAAEVLRLREQVRRLSGSPTDVR